MCFTNRGLAEYARSMVGNPYIYGTYGTLGNEKLLATKRQQYPNYVTENRVQIIKANPEKYFNKPWHDCAGLVKGYLMRKGITVVYQSRYDLSANEFYNRATSKGPLDTLPEIIGLGLWKNNHLGIYIGGGRCVQAKGFDYGVIESDLAGFTNWCELPFIEYDSEDTDSGSETPAEPAPAPSSGRWVGRITTQYNALNIRALPSTVSRVVGTVPKNSLQVFTGEAEANMYHLADGRGWCSANYVKKE